MNTANVCRYCGKPFVSWNKKTVCKDCSKIEEAEFQKIADYLKKFPNSNAIQIAEGLDISPLDVVRFIDEGRLTVSKGDFKKL